MKYVICAVYDRAAAAYGRPIFVLSVGGAIRSFQDEINRVAPENEMNRHPKDFDLYELGTFDDGQARFEIHEDGPRCVAIGGQLELRFEGGNVAPIKLAS